MQVDKTLIKSIALGIGLTLTTSCSMEEKMTLDPDDCGEGCTEQCVGACVNAISTEGSGPEYNWENCPGCGMG